MEKEKLVELAKGVAERRAEVEDAKQDKIAAERVSAETKEGKHLRWCIDDLAGEQEGLTKAEDELKTAVLDHHKETKETKPIAGVEVKMFRSVTYTVAIATAWCKKNALSLLTLNKKAFEKVAEEMDAPVKVSKEPKCTLAKDLSVYLEPATETAEVSEGGK